MSHLFLIEEMDLSNWYHRNSLFCSFLIHLVIQLMRLICLSSFLLDHSLDLIYRSQIILTELLFYSSELCQVLECFHQSLNFLLNKSWVRKKMFLLGIYLFQGSQLVFLLMFLLFSNCFQFFIFFSFIIKLLIILLLQYFLNLNSDHTFLSIKKMLKHEKKYMH